MLGADDVGGGESREEKPGMDQRTIVCSSAARERIRSEWKVSGPRFEG